MSKPIRVAVFDGMGGVRRHAHRGMASIVEGIESQGYNVKLLSSEEKDLNGDGRVEVIQYLDIDGDKKVDLEIVGIDNLHTDDPTLSTKKSLKLFDKYGFRGMALREIALGRMGGNFDYINISSGLKNPPTSKKAAKKYYCDNKRKELKWINKLSKKSTIYTAGFNSVGTHTYSPLMFAKRYKKSLHLVSDPQKYQTEHNITAPAESNARRIPGQGFDTDNDGTVEISDTTVVHTNAYNGRAAGNSYGSPFALGLDIASTFKGGP